MRSVIIALAFLGYVATAHAQPAQPYYAPDAELWGLMTKAIADLPMSYSTHQQVQQIFSNVQQQARMREVSAKAATDAAKPKDDPK